MSKSESESAQRGIRRVAVLGAGTMGAQIAALIAGSGVECDLLDLSADIADEGKRRLLSMRPKVVDNDAVLERIRSGSFDEDLPCLSESDWIIEAIVERLEPKVELWRRVAAHVHNDAVLSTNTSGIPIARIAQALPENMRGRFLGTHFFNPPRYLKLLELIPTNETNSIAIDTARTFVERTLDKGVVTAHDVPGFITNRIGCYYFLSAMRAADEYGLTPDEADAVSGPLMGRSSSATYRTIDLVGVDILLDICDNTRAAVHSPAERQAFEPPEYLREMRRRDWLGSKSGQGFYKRVRGDGGSRILALNHRNMKYAERSAGMPKRLAAISAIEDTSERLRALVASNDAVGKFAWRVLARMTAFSAWKVGEVADDIISIDRAMRWGFNWQLGPFESWDALGIKESAERMECDELEVPDWVARIAKEDGSFYRREGDTLMQANPSGRYERVPD